MSGIGKGGEDNIHAYPFYPSISSKGGASHVLLEIFVSLHSTLYL